MRQEQLTDTNLTTRIKKVFEQTFHRELPFSADLERAGEPRWTSLQHIELLLGLEVEFNIRFDGADATDMQSIATVISRVRAKLC